MVILPKKAYMDSVCARVVKMRGKCENCGSPNNLEWAHIVGRAVLHVRWKTNNAFCLCHDCHRYYHAHPIEFEEFCISMMGEEKYDSLKRFSNMPFKPDFYGDLQELKKERKLLLDKRHAM